MDGLAGIVENELERSPTSKTLFVFVNKKRDKLKILYWEKNGFVVWYKRLEKQTFKWCKPQEKKVLTVKELNWLLDGYDVFNFKPHEPIAL